MADECTDITTVEELSVFCRWEENGLPVEHFLEIIHLQKTDTESIYTPLIERLKQKNLQVSRIVGMGFDGASTFSGKKTGVQTRMKKLAPHALLYTATATCYSWLVFKLLIPHQELSMSM